MTFCVGLVDAGIQFDGKRPPRRCNVPIFDQSEAKKKFTDTRHTHMPHGGKKSDL